MILTHFDTFSVIKFRKEKAKRKYVIKSLSIFFCLLNFQGNVNQTPQSTLSNYFVFILKFYQKNKKKNTLNHQWNGWCFFKIQYLSIFSFPCVWFEISSYFSTLKLDSEVLLVCHMNRDKQSTICTLLFDFMILLYFTIFYFYFDEIQKKIIKCVKSSNESVYNIFYMRKILRVLLFLWGFFYFVLWWGIFIVYIILILLFNHANNLDPETIQYEQSNI